MNPWLKLTWLFALLGAAVALKIGLVWCVWGWFLVPLGAPPIGVAHAAGLCVIVAGLRWTRRATKEEEARAKKMTAWEAAGPILGETLTLLAMAYAAHAAMP